MRFRILLQCVKFCGALESSKQLKVSQPGNFLHQSRASFVQHDFEDIPQFEHPGTVHYQSPSEPLIRFNLEEETSETSDSDELIRPAAMQSRGLDSLQSGVSSQEFPLADASDQNLIDCWTPPNQNTSIQPTAFQEDSPHAYAHVRVRRMVMPEPSVRLSPEMVNGNEKIPTALRFDGPSHQRPVDSAQNAKQSATEAFVESNLMDLSRVRLGIPSKLQPHKSARFSRSNAFVRQ